MADTTTVLLKYDADITKALNNIKEVEKALRSSQSTINNQLAPSTVGLGNKVTAAGTKVKQLGDTIKSKIGTEGALAFMAVGAAVTSFTKQCVDSAVKSESSWTQFGALVKGSGDATGETVGKLTEKIKEYSNQWGYAVSDTREAANTLLMANVPASQLESALKGVGALAARTGKTEAEAASIVTAALNGRAAQFNKLSGLRLQDYQDAQGNIDQERLLNDLYNKNNGALEAHADTTEAALNRMDTAWGSVKTSIGKALLPSIEQLASFAEQVAKFFGDLPEPVKQFIATFLLIVGAVMSVLGAVSFLMPVFTLLGSILTTVGGAITAVIGFFSSLAGFIGMVGGVGGLASVAMAILEGAFASLMAVLSPIIVPLLAIIAAFTALYFIGQQMGWWSDLGGMISAVTSALANFVGWLVKLVTDFPAAQEEFNNFIGSLGDMLSAGLGALAGMAGDALQGLWNSIVSFFSGIGGQLVSNAQGLLGGFQELGQLVGDALGGAWDTIKGAGEGLLQAVGEMFKGAITGAISYAQSFVGDLIGAIMDGLTNLGASVVPGGGLVEGILAIIAPLPMMLYSAFVQFGPMVIPAVTQFINMVVQGFSSFGSRVLTAITSRFTAIVTGVRLKLTLVVQTIRTRLLAGVLVATSMAQRIRQAIINKFNQIVARVRQIFQNIVSTVRSRLASAASAARQKAQEIYQGIKDKVTSIPQMVADEFNKIKDKIKSALDNAKHTAVSCINDLVASVKSALGIASPGFIQRMVTWEFNSLSGIIGNAGTTAALSAGRSAAGIVDSWNRNMDTLGVRMSSDLSGEVIPQFSMLGGGNVNDIATMSMNRRQNIPNNVSTNNTRNTVNHDNHSTVYHIDKITLECADLTQAQSREILYNALDGLTGGTPW